MTENEGDRISPRTRMALLVADGVAMLIAFILLVTLALRGKPTLVEDVNGAHYGGPFIWIDRIIGFNHMSSTARGAWYISLMAILAVLYIIAIYLVRRQRGKRFAWVIAGGFLLFSMLFLFIPSYLSTDPFAYAFYGRAMTVYHKNPYLLLPVGRKQDILYPLIGWKSNASVYGPIFNWLSALVSRVAGDNIWYNVFGFKLLAFLAYAGSLPIVYSLAKRVSPGRENFALAFSAWSPLLIMHLVGAGHNDAIMMFFVLLGFYLYRKGHPFWGMVMMSFAVCIKVSAVLALLPMVVLFIKERRGKLTPTLGQAFVAAVLVPVALYIPFWSGPEIFKTTLAMQKTWSTTSLPTMMKNVLTSFFNGMGIRYANASSFSIAVVKYGFLLLLIVVAVAILWRVRTYKTMIVAAAALALLWFLTAPYVLPWYLAASILVAAVAGWNATTAATLATSIVFMFYRIPRKVSRSAIITVKVVPKTPVVKPPVPNNPLYYLGIPFLIILILWLLFSESLPRLKDLRNGGPGAGSGEGDC